METFELAKSLGHDRGGEFGHLYDFSQFYCTPGDAVRSDEIGPTGDAGVGGADDTRSEVVVAAQRRKRAYREMVAKQTGGQISVNTGHDLF